MEKLTRDQSLMCEPRTLQDLRNVTSSQGSEGGATPCAYPDGQTTGLCGPEAVPASHSASLARGKEQQTSGTSGLTSTGSSQSGALQLSLASRLQARLEGIGSPECSLIWKAWDMPAREPICALRASGRRIFGKDFTGSHWPTPQANKNTKNSKDPQQMKEGGVQTALADAVWITDKATWATPRVSTNGGIGHGTPERMAQARLEDQACGTATWPTPTTRDGKDGSYCPNVPTNSLLGREAWSGDGAPTKKKGALNPEFVCWLMGFPTGWDDCAVMVTPLSRKSRRSS